MEKASNWKKESKTISIHRRHDFFNLEIPMNHKKATRANNKLTQQSCMLQD
jgi:hypothetical protein